MTNDEFQNDNGNVNVEVETQGEAGIDHSIAMNAQGSRKKAISNPRVL